MSLAASLARIATPPQPEPEPEPELSSRGQWGSAYRIKTNGGPALAGMTDDEFYRLVDEVTAAGLPILPFPHSWPTPQK